MWQCRRSDMLLATHQAAADSSVSPWMPCKTSSSLSLIYRSQSALSMLSATSSFHLLITLLLHSAASPAGLCCCTFVLVHHGCPNDSLCALNCLFWTSDVFFLLAST